MIENVLTISLTLFSVIDMLGNIPLIIKLRKEHGHINSLKGTIVATVIMIIGLLAGKQLFLLLGIEVSHFAIAGSLLLIYFGVKMVLGIDGSSKNGNDMNATVFPIAFPLIAGPGTLSTIISFRASFSDFEIILGILINALIIYIVLKSADRIKNAIGANGIMIIERFFGIILISIGVKIFLENLIASLNAIG